MFRPAPPVPCRGDGLGAGDYEPDVDALPEPERGGAPSGGAPDPDGGVLPVPDVDPLPMLGQFLEEPELEPEPVGELEEPVPEFPEPLLPVFELDEGAVGGDEPELLPELPVVVDVVAALATSAPPARSPEVRAPTASTLRRRICMVALPFVSWDAGPFGPVPQTMRLKSECDRRMT